MSPNDADGMANSVDPDQTAPLGAVWSGSALFAQAYLSENLGSLQYFCSVNSFNRDWQNQQLFRSIFRFLKKVYCLQTIILNTIK